VIENKKSKYWTSFLDHGAVRLDNICHDDPKELEAAVNCKKLELRKFLLFCSLIGTTDDSILSNSTARKSSKRKHTGRSRLVFIWNSSTAHIYYIIVFQTDGNALFFFRLTLSLLWTINAIYFQRTIHLNMRHWKRVHLKVWLIFYKNIIELPSSSNRRGGDYRRLTKSILSLR